MNIAELQRLQSQRVPGTDEPRALPQPRDVRSIDSPSFAETFANAIDQVNDAQSTAAGQVQAFVSGEQENLHEVMIAMNEAKVSLQLMTEVRNKMLETYQELMRMQV